MSRFLAGENVPAPVIDAIRAAGFDVTSVHEVAQGIDDEDVLALAVNESRVLVTFDKDFGELAFRGGAASCGIILVRLHDVSLDELVRTIVKVMSGDWTWAGYRAVVDKRRLRFRRFP